MLKDHSLPLPDADALAHSAKLLTHLQQQIAQANGALSFDRYMEAALYTPGLGYYSAGTTKLGGTLGDGSDFTTAPELSPYFGRSLALQIAQICQEGLPENHQGVLEFGAGNGKLAADIMLQLDALAIPCPRYAILDLSGELRERQRAWLTQTFAQAGKTYLMERLVWLDKLPTDFVGVMIGNEVLDAMPVKLFIRRQSQWQERCVTWRVDSSSLAWLDCTPKKLPAILQTLPDTGEYLTETHEAAEGFMRSLAGSLKQGAIILIDYGFPEAEYYHPQRHLGTLMGHYRHYAHADPFLYPGLSDITAHVNFTGIAQAACDAGLDLLGYCNQARFLVNAGITDLLAELDPSDAKTFLPITNAVQKLLSEAEMGELFKVISFGKNLEIDLQGFQSGDRSHAL